KILHLAISSLPKNQQIAFTLHNYEDLSYKQIAQIMQRSISSVESLIFRARKNLQKKLWEWYKNSRV
ncbi:MAG: RNA polymerase sigma factor, partial [Bacteroidetes bacterium]|nr:RNA polymerase sigma factor [Bacteroidota bacterium]